jgi:hypothetical protein
MRRIAVAVLVWIVFCLLAVLALYLPAAKAQEEDALPVRVLCERGQLAAIQFQIPEPGVYTIRIPRDVCGRSA